MEEYRIKREEVKFVLLNFISEFFIEFEQEKKEFVFKDNLIIVLVLYGTITCSGSLRQT